MANITSKKDTIKQELALIENANGFLTPPAVVERARNKKSPLHPFFTWEDTKAAEQYRLMEARWLIQEVKIEILGRQARGYFNARVQIENVPIQGYFSVDRMINNEAIYNEVLATALQELDHWSKKYRDIKELKEVINLNALRELKAPDSP